jgi:signal transduction histidine kinase
MSPKEVLKHDLQVIEHEAIRLHRLVDDLFTLSRAEVGRLTLRCVPTNVAPIVHQVVDTIAPLAWQNSRIQLTAEATDGVIVAMADEDRLEQLLRNLIQNSLRHTPPGGIVVVRTQTVGDEIALEVRDTGDGILPDELPHIWERFYQGKTSRAGETGAGVGLALVKELVEAMHGRVAVTSQPRKGACFSVFLPKAGLFS